ncbi:MAG: glycoside hydrolase family 44 protein [Methylococcus sp.]
MANTTRSEPWFNMPHKAGDDYVKRFAEVVKGALRDDLRIYVEYSNEVWNDAFSQGKDIEAWAQADLMYPSENHFTQRINWYGKRSGEVCKIWREVFGAQSERIICVVGAQASNTRTATQALECPLYQPLLGQSCQDMGLNAVAIAPYFGGYLGDAAFRSQVRKLTLDQLFEELNLGGLVKDTNPADSATVPDGGALAESYRWMDDYDSLASAKNIPILAYAGGQHLAGIGDVQNDALIDKLFKAANQDPRMAEAYIDYLNHWRSEPSGKFEVFIPYVLAQKHGRQGNWGILENIEQASSPKYGALSAFIGMSPCWWPECSLGSSSEMVATMLTMPVLPVATRTKNPAMAASGKSAKSGKTAPGIVTTANLANATMDANDPSRIYEETLATNWKDWSWGATAVFSNTSRVHNGAYSISVTYSRAWAGFYLHSSSSIDTRLYDRIDFWVHGGDTGTRELKLVVNGNSSAARKISAPSGTWTQFTIPFSELGNPQAVSEFYLQDTSGTIQPEFFIDDIKLVKAPPPELSLTVDGGLERHKISDDIYGMNFAEEALARELRLPVNRWGGNRRTKYNWQSSMTNTGRDWFYETLPEGTVNEATLPSGSASDQFVDQNLRTGTKSIITLPMIGWVAKSTSPRKHPYDCSFKVSKYGAQQSVDNWDKDCGNGIRADGTPIQNNDPNEAHEFINKQGEAVDQGFVADWLKYLASKYKTADQGGVSLYSLDNEPMLWHSNHRDVHPSPVTYDEIRDLSYRYGAAVKAIDPKAKSMGPVVYGWCAYFHSAKDGCKDGTDSEAHGNLPFIPWYLSQMQAYEQLHHVRILDYLDIHYYPQADGIALSAAGDSDKQALRLRSTRSLWDETYTDESWISDLDVNGVKVRVIRRMKEWINTYYPGTLLAISEYNWGGLESLNGALAQADVLGIFGREGVDLATIWEPPVASEPGAFAFRMYRNYDGLGHGFGDISLSAASNDSEAIALFAALRSSDNAITIMAINKSNAAVNKPIQIKELEIPNTASVYRYSGDNLAAILKMDEVSITGGSLPASLPPYSMTLFVLRPATSLATLSLTKSGMGQGEVTANLGALNWTGNTGIENYVIGAKVCLTANPLVGSKLGAWSGCDSPDSTCIQPNQCLVNLQGSRNLSVTFDQNQYRLTVNATGTNSGTVTSTTNAVNFTYPATNTLTVDMNHGSGIVLSATGNDMTSTQWQAVGCDLID